MMGFERRVAIDGLRGLFVCFVVFFHLKVPFFDYGYSGVDGFFVISGFVITSILHHEFHSSKTIKFATFYSKRFKRLLPSSLAVSVITSVIYSNTFPTSFVKDHRESLITSTLFVENICLIIQSKSYFSPEAQTSPLMHYWSLAVEEQFYFIFPISLFALLKLVNGKQKAIPIVLSLVCGFLIFYEIQVIVSHSVSASALYFGTEFRLYQLLSGAVLSLYVFHVEKEALREYPLLGSCMANLGLILFVVISCPILVLSPVSVGGFSTVVTLAMIIGFELNSNSLSATFLSSPFMQFLGRHSYCIYLWHYPVIILSRMEVNLMSQIGCFACTLLLSFLFDKYIQFPIRKLNFLSHRNVLLVFTALIIVSAMVITLCTSNFASPSPPSVDFANILQEDIPTSYSDQQMANTHNSDKVGDPSLEDRSELDLLEVQSLQDERKFNWRKPHYFVIGDSMVAQWYYAFEELGEQRSDLYFEVFYTYGCVLGNASVFWNNEFNNPYDCSKIEEGFEMIKATTGPKVVLLSFFSYYEVQLKDPVSDKIYNYGDPGWKEFVIAMLEELLFPFFDDTRFILIETPLVLPRETLICLGSTYPSNPEKCPPFHAVYVNNFELLRELYTDLVNKHKEIFMVDVVDLYCPGEICQTTFQGQRMYADGLHLNEETTFLLLPSFLDLVKPYLGPYDWDEENQRIVNV